ncbi:biotin/lipoyl-binding protein [Klebsiella pneumoniae]|uniref:FUSC family protein n=1 Tax=Klebsiella pneumoniae TaxID=573 RepID=UPI00165EDE4A|nr:FUSC family protein [Klebsiella pneumoniae]EKU8964516.1 FUSC family protein [Klebsiella pneumoniae]MBC9999999.1 FUSC family protein [Klebsiella pneumoniae]HBR6948630.1 FUSC family protein [Klebsiella pneumoniae]HBS6269764.1 FUSC family protein [Klebsiella pneumoniae]HCA9606980.1 FUSC family protein [Klebsiella pneumoniae]
MTTSRTSLLRKKWPLLALVLAAILALILVIWQLQTSPETNDAYVYADTIDVVPEVSGRIVEMPIRDNQRVKKGDLLFRIDPRPYQAMLDDAKARLTTLICYVFYTAADWQGLHTIMLSCVIVAQPGLGATMQKTWLRIGGALLASLLALLLIVFVQPWTDSLTGLLAMSLPVLALAAWIAAGSERIAYAGIQIGFTFALAFLSWFAPLTNLTELRDRVLGILLGVLVSSIVHLYLWPDSEAPQLKTRLAALYRRLADCLAAPKEAVPLAPLLVAFTDSEALIHRVRAEPLGTYAHPWPQAKDWPMRATLAQAEEIARLSEGYRLNAAPGDPTLARCAEQLRRYAERIEQEATAPGEQLTAELTNPFGPALAAALAALPDWGPTPIATEQQAKTS